MAELLIRGDSMAEKPYRRVMEATALLLFTLQAIRVLFSMLFARVYDAVFDGEGLVALLVLPPRRAAAPAGTGKAPASEIPARSPAQPAPVAAAAEAKNTGAGAGAASSGRVTAGPGPTP